MIKYLLSVLFLFLSFGLNAQYQKMNSISGFLHSGWVLPTNEYLKGYNLENLKIDYISTISLRYQTQTNGSKDWHQLYDYPEMGFGIYTANFYAPKELGYPIAIYAFISNSMYKWGKFNLRNEFSLGIAGNWKHWTKENPYNKAIGGAITCYIDAGVHLDYPFTKRLIGSLGLTFSHFSTGAMVKPNLGVNTMAPRFTLKYNLYDKPEYYLSHYLTLNIVTIILLPYLEVFIMYLWSFPQIYQLMRNMQEKVFLSLGFLKLFSRELISNTVLVLV